MFGLFGKTEPDIFTTVYEMPEINPAKSIADEEEVSGDRQALKANLDWYLVLHVETMQHNYKPTLAILLFPIKVI